MTHCHMKMISNILTRSTNKADFDRAFDAIVTIDRMVSENDPRLDAALSPVEYVMDANGGFYAADVDSKVIEYAYPTSNHATEAKRNPELVALAMLFPQCHITADTEQPQWMVDRWNHMRTAMLASRPILRSANNTTVTAADGCFPSLV